MWNKNKKDKQTETSSIVTKETVGFTLGVFSLLILLISFTGESLFGKLGLSITSFFFGLFGTMSYGVFFILLYFSVTLIVGKNFIPSKSMTASGVGFVAFVGLLVHAILTSSYPQETYGEYLSACFEAGNQGVFACTPFGALGGLISYPFMSLATPVGAYIIFVAGIGLCGYIFLNSFLVYSGIRFNPRKQKGEISPAQSQQENSASQAQPFSFEDVENIRTPQTGEEYPSVFDSGHSTQSNYPTQPNYPPYPGYSTQSAMPEQPNYPSYPGYSTQPAMPEQPNYPSYPGYSTQSAMPEQPMRPAQPTYTQPVYWEDGIPAPSYYPYSKKNTYIPQDDYSPKGWDKSREVYQPYGPSSNVVFDKTGSSPYAPQGYDPCGGVSVAKNTAKQSWNDVDGNALRNALFDSTDSPSDYRKKNLIFDTSSNFRNRSQGSPSTPSSTVKSTTNSTPAVKPTETSSVSPSVSSSQSAEESEKPVTRSSYSQMYSNELDDRNTAPAQPLEIVQNDAPAQGGYSLYKTEIYDEYTAPSDAAELTVRPSYKAPESVRSATPITPVKPTEESVQSTSSITLDVPARTSVEQTAPSRDREQTMSLRDRFSADREKQMNERLSRDNTEMVSDSVSEREKPTVSRRSLFDDNRTIDELEKDFILPDFKEEETRAVPPERSRAGLSSAIRENRPSPSERLSPPERDGERETITPPSRGSSVSEPPARGESVSVEKPSFQQKSEPSAKTTPPKPKIIRDYVRPPLDLFDSYADTVAVDMEEVEANKRGIMETLAGFNIAADVVRVTTGPSFTRYEITIPKNVMAKNVARYSDNIAMSLHAESINIYSNFTQGTVAIEVPNRKRSTVGMRNMLQSEAYLNAKPGSLMFCIGKNVEGKSVCGSLTKMPHMLIAGATGSGKSVFLNELIISLIIKYSPEEVRLILIDPKQIEFAPYDQLPHLMINEIIADVQKAIVTLNWAINEMERRYTLFKQMTTAGTTVRNIDEYNAAMTERADKLPKLVIIVDELADLMSVAKKDIEDRISRIAAKARAAGIHLVLATQRPSVDVVTGVLKANLPSRFAFRVSSGTDSGVILDETGAENLLGSGDLLYKTGSMFGLERVQGAWLDSSEIQRVCDFIRKHNEAYYDESVANFINNEGKVAETGSEEEDGNGEAEPVYIDALRYVVQSGSASISMIQRKCSVGYNKAGKIIEWMESNKYISPFDGAKSRKVLLSVDEFKEKYGEI